jgi:cytoskeletal protein RodZ
VPETRVERAVFVLGVLAIAVLGFLVAHLWHRTHAVAPPGTASLSTPAQTSARTRPAAAKIGATAVTGPTTAGATTSAATSEKTTAAPAAGAVSLVLTARVETWIEVRSGSATGAVLYTGMLPVGSSKAFRSRSLWARFGSGGNLSARLDGKSLHLPSGTYDALFDEHGFRQLGA